MSRQHAAREREAAILRLRAEGRTFAQIADDLGFSSASTCHRAYRRALDRTVREAADELRALESERLDALWRRWFALATDPDNASHQAARVCLRIMERRARLLGLDAPTRAEVLTPELDEQIRAELEAVAELPVVAPEDEL